VEGGCARSSKTVDLYLFTHLSPWMGLNLGEFELGVVWVHFPNLLTCGSAKHLWPQTQRKTSQVTVI